MTQVENEILKDLSEQITKIREHQAWSRAHLETVHQRTAEIPLLVEDAAKQARSLHIAWGVILADLIILLPTSWMVLHSWLGVIG